MSRLADHLGPGMSGLTARTGTRRRGAWQGAVSDLVVGATRWLEQVAVSGPDSRHARRFQHVGDGSAFAYPPGPTMGERWIRIGSGTLIGPRVVLSAGIWPGEALDPEHGWTLSIGDRCLIGRGSALVSRTGIEIGDDVIMGPNVYITDHNHDYARTDVAIRRQWIVERGVTIGAGSWLGVGAVILPGTTLGRQVVVGAGSIVGGEIPDHCVVAGAPARVIRRWDGDHQRWDPPPGDAALSAVAPDGWFDEPEP